MTKLRLYVDEVGNPDLGHSDDPNHRFLSLTGVALDLRHKATLLRFPPGRSGHFASQRNGQR